jgi:hypothetical protein
LGNSSSGQRGEVSGFRRPKPTEDDWIAAVNRGSQCAATVARAGETMATNVEEMSPKEKKRKRWLLRKF